MAQILKFPGPTSKLGYKRVRRRSRSEENPGQLDLFSRPTAQILDFTPDLSRFEQALLFDEQGDPKAAELYAKAIEEHDCVADAYCNLGIIESQKGNTTRAFDCFTTSLKHDPRHAEAHYNLGNLYFDLNDFRLGQIHYEMAAELDPAFPSVYFNLALVQVINDEAEEASKALNKYRSLVSGEEARNADELFHSLKKLLATARSPQARSK